MTLYRPVAKDEHIFKLDVYRKRMARFLPPDDESNQIFYEALQFAYELHDGQVRKSGAPYISHPCAVAEVLARSFFIRDPQLLAAALLHDVVEDIEEISLDEIHQRFGATVAELVDGCTKLTRSQKHRSSLKDLTHSKIFLSASRQLGVLIIKLADRLHNMRTLHYLAKSKRQRIAQETIEVYAPLAAKLNIFSVKRELYHLALIYMYPRKSKKILNVTKSLKDHQDVKALVDEARSCLAELPFDIRVRMRVKGLGAYYNPANKTLRLQNVENRVDLIVVVDGDDPLNCYTALGAIHRRFSPIPRTMRDFIANPKNNGYMSLHSRLNFLGEAYLVKVRTAEMDRWAKYGLVSDWGRGGRIRHVHLEEVSEFLRSLGEYGEAGAKRRVLLRLSEQEEVSVYTPAGELQTFPKGSVVLDFAYKIHSDIGNHCQGARVNGELSPPTRLLSDGDTVEIIKSDQPHDVDPELEYACKTPKARSAINRQLQSRRRRYAREIGRQILIQELERRGLSQEMLDDENTALILEVLNVKELDELYIRIGQDLIAPDAYLYYFEGGSKAGRKKDSPPEDTAVSRQRNVLRVSELDCAVHKFARCCQPFPGQEQVVATISERGVTFHQGVCRDLHDRYKLSPHSLLDVHWAEDPPWPHSLVFLLEFMTRSQEQLFTIVGSIPPFMQFQRLEITSCGKGQKCLQMSVVLESYGEARRLFGRFPVGSVAVKAYSRFGGRAWSRNQGWM